MKTQIGEIWMDASNNKMTFPNKTFKYLLPCLKEYGNIFRLKISNVFKVAVGLGDIVVDKYGTVTYERHVFILIDSSIANKFFVSFLEWIRTQPMYENDYVYDDIQKSNLHMVVIKLPEKYYDSFLAFNKGKYSEMFQGKTIEEIFDNHPDAVAVLIKDHNYKVKFLKRLNKFLNNTNPKDHIKPNEWEGEIEFPPTSKEEIFNNHLK